jgi:hypothetical protein
MRTVLLPATTHFALNVRIFGFALLLCLAAAILAGLSSGWQASRTALMSSIKSGISNPSRVRLQDLLETCIAWILDSTATRW